MIFFFTPKVQETKEKISKWDYIKLNFLYSRGKILKNENATYVTGENIASQTYKGLIFKLYKELIQLNSKEANNPILKWLKELNRYFSEEDLQMANMHMKG